MGILGFGFWIFRIGILIGFKWGFRVLGSGFWVFRIGVLGGFEGGFKGLRFGLWEFWDLGFGFLGLAFSSVLSWNFWSHG